MTRRWWLLLGSTLLGCAVALWWSITAVAALPIDVGAWGDHAYLQGINGVEQSSTESYRWTTDRTLLSLPNLGSPYRALTFRAHGWRPEGSPAPQLTLEQQGQRLGTIQLDASNRVYRVLLATDPTRWSTNITFETPAFSPAGDPRVIGVALDWLDLRAVGASTGPAPLQFIGQALLLGLGFLLVRSLGLPVGWAAAASGLLVLALLSANLVQPLWVSAALPAWLLVVVLLLVISAVAGPQIARLGSPWLDSAQARTAWALLIGALLIRLLGAVHPLFDTHDLPYHTGWLRQVVDGNLFLYGTPSEFNGRQTFYPPAGYLLLMPLLLVLDSSRLVVQVGGSVFDWVGCVLVLLLARELRLGARAGLLALAVYVLLPINMTMLWWGFATNALAQPAWLLLLWLLLRLIERPNWRVASAFAAVAVVAMMMHVGALVLIVATLGLLLAQIWWRLSGMIQRLLLGSFGAAAVIIAALYLSAVLPPVLAQRVPSSMTTASTASGGLDLLSAGFMSNTDVRVQLLSKGMSVAFVPLSLLLMPPGIVLLLAARDRHPILRPLVWTWLAVVLASIVAYLVLGLVTRDLYFAAPLVCLALGVVLSWLWQRRGRLLVLAFVALIALNGTSLWFGGVLMRVKPSATALTR